jgi:PAS domain S-box-containing protein
VLSENIDRFALSHSFDEKLFRLLVASISDYAIFMIDPNGYIMSWNPGAQNIKGYTEEEIIGKHISIFYTENDIKKNEPRHNLNEALKNGMRECEGWRVRKDGSVFWANVVFTTVYNDSGHLVGFAKITRDITDRKKNEDKKEKINAELERRVKQNTEKIIANELRFRKLIENNNDGITLLNKNLDVLYRSMSSERITGWSYNERSEHGTSHLIHPDDRAMVKQLFVEILDKPGAPITASYRTKHKNGQHIWIESLFTNWLNDENIKAIVCNFRDITEQKVADEELRKKNEQIENILESITDGFIALDKDFCYTYANKKIGEMLNCAPESLIRKYIWTEFPDVVHSETYKAFNRAANKHQYVCNEDYYAPLDLWQENHIYPSAGGGLSVFIRDISERK